MNEIISGMLFLSLLAGLATILGGLIVFRLGIPNEKFMAAYLGIAAGVMTIVTVDLITHAFQVAQYTTIIVGMATGLIFVKTVSVIIGYIHQRMRTKRNSSNLRYTKIGWTILIGIAAHNFPEGLAIAAGDVINHQLGLSILVALALHNIPEGIGVAAPMIKGGTRKWVIVFAMLLAALCVPFGTWVGFTLIEATPGLIAITLSFAAGAMLYIVVFELIPQSFQQHPLYAMIGIMTGIMLLSMVH